MRPGLLLGVMLAAGPLVACASGPDAPGPGRQAGSESSGTGLRVREDAIPKYSLFELAGCQESQAASLEARRNPGGEPDTGVLASVIVVTTEWTFDEINNIMDGNPATLGRGGQPDAQAGDTIVFAEGTYNIPMRLPEVYFRLRINGVNISGAGMDRTTFVGASQGSVVWLIQSSNNTLANFTTTNAVGGLDVLGANYDNIVFRNIKSIGHEQHYPYMHQDAPEPLGRPSIWLDGCHILGGELGVVFNRINVPTLGTKYAGVINCTIEDLSGTAITGPLVPDDGSGNPIFLGNDSWESCIIRRVRASFPEPAYRGMRSPGKFVEAEVPPGTSLYERGIGQYNLLADPMLNADRRPMKGSPAIAPWHRRGYAGAFPPVEWEPQAGTQRAGSRNWTGR